MSRDLEGDMMYLRPAPFSGIDSFEDHQYPNRNPGSKEPGVDYYMPIGTPLYFPADGVIVEYGGGVGPATGRYTKVNFDDGRATRFLHLADWGPLRNGSRGRQGIDLIGYSGASGYGSEFFGYGSLNDPAMWNETGGPHVHLTLFPSHSYDNFRGLLDFERYASGIASGAPAGGGSTPFPSEEDDMTKYVQVKDDRGNFALVGPDGVGRILNGAALRGAQKIALAANGGALPEVELSGEEWDSASLSAFSG